MDASLPIQTFDVRFVAPQFDVLANIVQEQIHRRLRWIEWFSRRVEYDLRCSQLRWQACLG